MIAVRVAESTTDLVIDESAYVALTVPLTASIFFDRASSALLSLDSMLAAAAEVKNPLRSIEPPSASQCPLVPSLTHA